LRIDAEAEEKLTGAVTVWSQAEILTLAPFDKARGFRAR
jgi:hypothetical protein